LALHAGIEPACSGLKALFHPVEWSLIRSSIIMSEAQSTIKYLMRWQTIGGALTDLSEEVTTTR